MREKIELNRNREFGDIISDTFVVVKQNFKPLLKSYFIICGLFLLADVLVSAFINTNRIDATLITLPGIIQFAFSIINSTSFLVVTFSYLALYKEKGNTPPDVLEVWGYFRYFFFRVLITQILTLIAVLLGFVFCILPGIYLCVVFSLVIPIMIFENASIEFSFKKAFKIIKGNWWFSFGTILVISIVILMVIGVLMLPPMLIYGGGQWLTGKNLDNIAGILQAISLNFCKVLWMITMVGLSLLYFSLTEQKEGTSLIDRINMFGKNAPDNNQASSSEQY